MGRVRGQLLCVVLALGVVAVLAGCGGSSSKSASGASTVTSATTASGSTTATSTQSTASSTPAQTSSNSSTTTTTTSASSTSGAAKPAVSMVTLTSPAFKRGSKIPVRYTCDGANESPPLQWSNVPAKTAQLLLFVLDLAGGPKGSVRWAVGDISPNVHSISANSIPASAVVGRNSLGKANWGGVCPAKGKSHSYVFLLYALRKKLTLASGFPTTAIQRQLGGNIAGAGIVFGTYQRS
jgi:Raf kinase inhibitor-like YbhB/YbcL family protein